MVPPNNLGPDLADPHCFNVESDFVESLLNHDTFINFSSKFDFSGELAHVNPKIPKSDFDFEEEIRLIENLLYDNSSPRPSEEPNAKIADTIIESIPLLHILVQDGNSQQEEIDVVTETDDVLPPSDENDDDSSNDPLLEEVDLLLFDNSIPPGIENVDDDPEGDIRDSFCFKIEPGQERLINLMKNDISESSNDLLLEDADLFLFDDSIPPGIENFADDPEGDIRFLEELLIDNSILSHESFDSNFEDNPSIPRPPQKPPDVETDAGEEIPVVMNDKDEDLLELMLLKRSKENTKCVSAAGEEFTAAKHKLILLV
uniref:Reverse transcriptase domain-containing protein n=1 Tax=Tanacetum cinerariifolium TaxID=118510 RepID=A0A6L2MW71_TANCI|nr:hypothetical protein [Tanacetum cinerariifolium]